MASRSDQDNCREKGPPHKGSVGRQALGVRITGLESPAELQQQHRYLLPLAQTEAIQLSFSAPECYPGSMPLSLIHRYSRCVDDIGLAKECVEYRHSAFNSEATLQNLLARMFPNCLLQ